MSWSMRRVAVPLLVVAIAALAWHGRKWAQPARAASTATTKAAPPIDASVAAARSQPQNSAEASSPATQSVGARSLVFGEQGPVRPGDIPPGHFRRELLRLP